MLQALASDLRQAYRVIRSSPRFFLLLWLVLSGGLGAATATFSVVHAVLRPPLPYPDSDRLATVWTVRSDDARMLVSIQEFQNWKSRSRSFEQLAMSVGWMFSIGSPGARTEGIVGIHVSGDFFSVLNVQPVLGRLLIPADDRLGADRVAVLAQSVWEKRFESDPGLIGRRIELDSLPYTVVGIAPDAFRFSYPGNEPVYVWTPLAVSFPYYADQLGSPIQRDKHVIGRLLPGVSFEQAQLELSSLSARAFGGAAGDGAEARVVPFPRELVGSARRPALLAGSAVALLLLVMVCNVASLLLTRAQARRAELTMRAALGATRGRLIQQLATEIGVLFLLAAPAGAAAAQAFLQLFYALVLGSHAGSRANGVYEFVPAFALIQPDGVQLDGRALLFGAGVCLGLGALSAVLPALRGSRDGLRPALQKAGAGAPAAASEVVFRSTLIVGQVALTFALLVGSGTAILELAELSRTPMGFAPTGVLAFRFLGSAKHYAQFDQLAGVYSKVMKQLRERPDVRGVAVSGTVPLSGDEGRVYLEILGREQQPAGTSALGVANSVSRGFFQTLQIPLLAGREFELDDLRMGRPVVLINRSLADAYFRGQDPLEQFIRIRQSGSRPLRVVGVVGDVLRDGIDRPPAPEVYQLLTQLFDDQNFILARADRPEQLLAELPGLVAAVDPTLGVWSWSMAESARQPLRYRSIVTAFSGAFAFAALCFALLGISGLVAHETSRRTREIGIRVALGSPALRVLWVVVRDALQWTLVGLAVGFCGVWVAERSLSEGILLGRFADAGLCALVALGIATVALASALVPAWRAVQMSPSAALRRD